MRKYSFYVMLLLTGWLASCGDDDSEPQCVEETPAQQEEEIDNYVTSNGLNMQTTASGLRYVINTPGTGDNAQVGDTVEVEFEGFFLNGTSFGQGTFDPFELGAVSLIQGFEEALTLLNEGAQATFILPSSIAYGCFPPQGSSIAQNQILIFEITMLSINP